MTHTRLPRSAALLVASVGLLVGTLHAKPWKSAELITRETYKYGAFEARIKAAEGSGMISTFFLWKDGSEWAGAEWQEQDFEIWGMNGKVQTQAMTPGDAALGTNRTEHSAVHELPTKAWERYYTYRMEWTPTYLAYYIDGQLVRKETDTAVYSKLLNPQRAEPMQLRTGLWAGDFGWSGPFDSTKAPQDAYVNWLSVYDYTPGNGPGGSDFSLRWKDDFNALDWGRWWAANWTFEYSVSDYAGGNLKTKDGSLVAMFRHWTQEGSLPASVPADDGLELPLGPVVPVTPLPGIVPASSFSDALDLTAFNEGSSTCGTGTVDLEPAVDPEGGCNVGYTYVGEWLEYQVSSPVAASYEITARLANQWTGSGVRVLVDGNLVGTAQSDNTLGWQAWENCPAGTVTLSAGKHTVRVEIDRQYTNFLSLHFDQVGAAPAQVTGLSAVAVGNGFDLAWAGTGSGTTYTVTRTVGGVPSVAAVTTDTWWSESGATSGVPYTYTVTASNSVGSGTPSAPVTVSYGRLVVLPGAVTGLTAVAGSGKATLAWTAASNTTAYHVYMDGLLRDTTTATTLTLTGLSNGQSYAFAVVGNNLDGEGPSSATVAATPAAVLPNQVTGLTAAAGDASADLAWPAAANATGYDVLVDGNLLATVTATSYTATGLTNGTSYAFSVVAKAADGNAPASTPVGVIPAVPVAPAASVKVLMFNSQLSPSTNGLAPRFKLVNTGAVDVALADLTLRYWFTKEAGWGNNTAVGQNYWCDWAQIGSTNIASSFKALATPRTGADHYLELGFKASAGTLKAGANTGEIQSRFSKSDWSNYSQGNDHSFSPTATGYVDWNKVTVYFKGQLIWGVEP